MSEKQHSLMQESLDHSDRARYFAAAAVKDLQCGQSWSAQNAMRLCAEERHLAYEKWDTAEIAFAALKECWAPRIKPAN
jgi:hypothetical protein